jgi:hypothetical protein
MAETHTGITVVVQRGFKRSDHAEDFPMRTKDYRRVWVAPIAPRVEQKARETAKSIPLKFKKKTTYAAFLQAAVSDQRAPMNGTFGVDSSAARRLAFDGVIRIDVYAKNWRVVTILQGEHAGKHTQMPPHVCGPAYITITKDSASRRYFRIAP